MYKLLIVDDEKMIRLGMKAGIPWHEIGIDEVFVAGSASEALEIIKENQPQIMITDINMNGASGLELIKSIRQENDKMRILVLSGYDKFEYARECLSMGVQDFHLKPIDEVELKNSVLEQVNYLEEMRISNQEKIKKNRTEGTKQQMQIENYLRDVIHNKSCEEEKCPEELSQIFNRTMQIGILIPNINMNKDVDDYLCQYNIKKICIDLIDAKGEGISFSNYDDRIVIVFYTTETEHSITENIQTLIGILKDEYEIKPRIVLGSKVKKLNNLHISYNDAMHILNEERKDFQEISMPSIEQNREDIIEDIYIEFKNAICDNLADGYKVMNIFDKFHKATVSYNLSTQLTKKWCFDLLSNLYFTYIMMTCDTPDNRIELMIKSFTFADKESVLELSKMFIKNLVLREENVHDEAIIKAISYIDENLEKEISVTSLAEMLYLSPNYFSRLFKKIMNEGCNEHIIRKRIEKSKYLLETTTIKSGEIAAMVGYNDTNYFSLAFKKYTGMSPTNYREKTKK